MFDKMISLPRPGILVLVVSVVVCVVTGLGPPPGRGHRQPPNNHNKDYCEPNPCVPGKCENCDDGYKCICNTGYTGKDCEILIDNCDPNPCINGTCHNDIDNYTCDCDPGYTGRNCEISIDYCDPNPCGVHGDCDNIVGNYKCTCAVGYTGVNCTIVIDNCDPNPCIHGVCDNHIGYYRCYCDVGYTGEDCEIYVIDNCASSPCSHGDCNNFADYYTCTCDAGYTGSNCETEISAPGYNCEDKNPCSPEFVVPGQYFYAHTDPSHYVQCSEFGECAVKPCPTDLVWDTLTNTCNYP